MFWDYPHDVTIIFPASEGTYDEAGTFIPGESVSEVVPAHVDVLSGSEYERAQSVSADTNAVIYVDYREDLDDARIRVQHGNKTYSISTIISQGGLDEVLGLYAKEVK